MKYLSEYWGAVLIAENKKEEELLIALNELLQNTSFKSTYDDGEVVLHKSLDSTQGYISNPLFVEHAEGHMALEIGR